MQGIKGFKQTVMRYQRRFQGCFAQTVVLSLEAAHPDFNPLISHLRIFFSPYLSTLCCLMFIVSSNKSEFSLTATHGAAAF